MSAHQCAEQRSLFFKSSNAIELPEKVFQCEPVMADSNPEPDNFLKEFYIPNYILLPNSEGEVPPHVPRCPVIVFINTKSGGRLGGALLLTYRSLLNKNQVFNLLEEAPDDVLRRLYLNLENFTLNGDEFAPKIQERLKILVAGGDGTANWLLGVVSDLKLSQPPPIAPVPMGTGNNIPFAFGWGKKNPGADRHSVESFLRQVLKAKEMKIDSWHLLMGMRAPKQGSCEPIAPPELPHSLHAFRLVSSTDTPNMEGYRLSEEGFGITSAWVWMLKCHMPSILSESCIRISTKTSWLIRNIAQLAKFKIMKKHGEWKDLHISRSIRSIVCLNLPSFSGGLNPWGTPNSKKQRDRDLAPPFVDDGLLEIVGFKDAWHGLVLLCPNGHGTRLAQAHRIRFEFHKGAADHMYMRIDGEPWKQPLPVDDDTVVVEISHYGQVKMLATPKCIAKSVHDQPTPTNHDVDGEDRSDDEDSVAEQQRKFGAADTFKIPYKERDKGKESSSS